MADDVGTDHPRTERVRLSRPAWLGVWAVGVVVAATVLSWAFSVSWWTSLGALVLGSVIFRTGWFFLQSFATPPPPPPDPGTLRKVKLTFRCNVCGTEVRMTAATDEDPEPPRHCMDDMDLVAPID
jgi:hypothetical protein